jgi:hypothetical protein
MFGSLRSTLEDGTMLKIGTRAIIKTATGLAEGWIVKVTLPEGSDHRRVTIVSRQHGEMKRHKRFSNEVRMGLGEKN